MIFLTVFSSFIQNDCGFNDDVNSRLCVFSGFVTLSRTFKSVVFENFDGERERERERERDLLSLYIFGFHLYPNDDDFVGFMSLYVRGIYEMDH